MSKIFWISPPQNGPRFKIIVSLSKIREFWAFSEVADSQRLPFSLHRSERLKHHFDVVKAASLWEESWILFELSRTWAASPKAKLWNDVVKDHKWACQSYRMSLSKLSNERLKGHQWQIEGMKIKKKEWRSHFHSRFPFLDWEWKSTRICRVFSKEKA